MPRKSVAKKSASGPMVASGNLPMESIAFSHRDDAPSLYVDGVRVIGSVFGFCFVMSQVEVGPDSQVRAKHVGNVYMSPQHMKALANLLRDRVGEYEKSHGTIQSIT